MITPEDQALDERLGKLPVIQELKENDVMIMEKLGSLEIGQLEIEGKLEEGSSEFKQIWAKVNEMDSKIDKLGETFNAGIEKLTDAIFKNKLDAAIDNNTKLAQKNKDLQDRLDKKEDKAWDVKKIVITSILTLVAIGIGVALGWR